MSPPVGGLTDCRPLLRRRRPRTVSAKLLTVAVSIALAVAIDTLTGGRWRAFSGGAAVLASVLVFLPGLSWLVKPVGAYAGVWLVFNLLRAWTDDTAWANRVLGVAPRLEARLFAGRLPSAVLQERFSEPPRFAWYDYGLTAVYLSFFVVPHLVAILLLWRSRRLFWRYLLATGTLFALALVGFFLIPTAPPWLVADTLPAAGLAEIRRLTEETLGTLDLPFRLYNHGQGEGARVSEVRFEPNPIAAMPSIHFASTALLVFPARRGGRLLGGAALLYAALMGAALVYLGEHYVLDLAVGGLLAALGWAVAGRCLANGGEDAASPIGRAGSQ
ncbi:MAG: phosphatase PAP2 family protein [Chloroflexota bacterium]|nr:phosphatase PAP2 family protein [Chloroflexota bacterium]